MLACGGNSCYENIMKPTVLILTAAMSSGGILSAQEFVAQHQETREIVPSQPGEIVTPKPSIEGIVKDIFVTRKPWQLVNPAAPASYGSGEKMVSKDFGPGTPYKSSGWIVFGVEW